jgi:hypothetical protein
MMTIVALDFSTKQERAVTPAELPGLLASGLFFWVDVDCAHCPDQGPQCGKCEALLRTLGMNALALAEVLGPDREGRYDVYDDCLHFAVSEARLTGQRLQTAHVDVVLGRSIWSRSAAARRSSSSRCAAPTGRTSRSSRAAPASCSTRSATT